MKTRLVARLKNKKTSKVVAIGEMKEVGNCTMISFKIENDKIKKNQKLVVDIDSLQEKLL